MKKVMAILPPLLLGVFFTLSFYSRNIDLIPLRNLWIPLLLSICLGLLSWGLFFIVFKSVEKSSLTSCLLIGAIFSSGYSIYVSIVLLAVIIAMVCWRVPGRFINTQSILIATIAALALVVVPSFSIVSYAWSNLSNASPKTHGEYTKGTPDIYYIIFDSYAGEQSLKEMGFDNGYFLSFLKEKGFYIAQDSFCNYPRTYLSLASSLNMSYLNVDEESINIAKASQRIENNEVIRLLKTKGYNYNHIGSTIFSPTSSNRYADSNYTYQASNLVLNEFSIKLYQTTIFNTLSGKNLDLNLREASRNAILYQFETLKVIAQNRGNNEQPSFTFCHILLPHHNHIEIEKLFNADGSYPTGNQLNRSVEESYINQVTYLNQRIIELVGDLLSNNNEPPIIILQGDEGRTSTDYYEYIEHPKEEQAASFARLRAPILNAIYLPNGGGEYLYPSISPVNTFRVIFKNYLGLDYKLLADKFFFPKAFISSGPGYPSWDFSEATDLIMP